MSLGEPQVFTTLNASSGYWEINADKKDDDITKFVTHHGFFSLYKDAIRSKGPPVTFQRAMDVDSALGKWQYAPIYLEDIVVISQSAQEHLWRIEEVLKLLKNAGVKIKQKNCHLSVSRSTTLYM